MIKIYPSALDSEPIETHKLKKKKRICDFLAELAPSFTLNREKHPISISVDSQNIPPSLWDTFYLKPQHQVAIIVQPKGAVIIVAAIVAVAAAAYSFFAMRKAKKGGSTSEGKPLDGADINANIARWGDPIPEIAGSPLTYPALLTPIHKWYKTDESAQFHATEYAEMLLCIGKGSYQVGLKDVFIGETPALLLSDKVAIQFFDAGEYLAGVDAADWWHESNEVGFTTFGGTGITLGVSSDAAPHWLANFTFAGNVITGTKNVPSDWKAGITLQNIFFTHTVKIGSNYISSEYLDSLKTRKGDVILIDDDEYIVNSVIQPEQEDPEQLQEIQYHLDTMEGLSAGTRTVTIGAGHFTILAINGAAIAVQPTSVGGAWSGFPAGKIDESISLAVDSLETGWAGAFRVAPEYTLIDKIEVDILYPQGLIRYKKKSGSARLQSAGGTIQYRRINIGENGYSGEWQSYKFSNTTKTPNQIGFTYVIDVEAGEYEVRVQADEPPSENTRTNNTQQWTRLKGRVAFSKKSYPDMTVMSIKMQSGDAVGGAVENKVKVRAQRILPTLENPKVLAPTSDIAPFFIYMMESVGYTREFIDIEVLHELNKDWLRDNDNFNMAFSTNTTLKEAAATVLKAGFAEMTVKDGLITAVQDKRQIGLPTRIFSPQEYTEPLTQSIRAIQPDEIDGVDVEFIEYKTGKKITESFRLPLDEGRRVEKVTLHGVTSSINALKHAQRRRLELAYRRIEYTGSTELHAMNCNYGDFIGLQDGIPQYGQSAFVVTANYFKLSRKWQLRMSEPILKYSDAEFVAVIRQPDGTISKPYSVKVNGHYVTLEGSASLKITPLKNNNEDATVMYFGAIKEFYYPAIITEIRPVGNKVSFTAVGYSDDIYTSDYLDYVPQPNLNDLIASSCEITGIEVFKPPDVNEEITAISAVTGLEVFPPLLVHEEITAISAVTGLEVFPPLLVHEEITASLELELEFILPIPPPEIYENFTSSCILELQVFTPPEIYEPTTANCKLSDLSVSSPLEITEEITAISAVTGLEVFPSLLVHEETTASCKLSLQFIY